MMPVFVRNLIIWGGVALIALPLAVQAKQPYDAKAFAAAQAADKSILVHVEAPWCPTCAKQRPIIQGLEAAEPRLVVFDVDFDSSKELLKQWHVQTQSALIVYKGANEVGRSTGQTDPAAIRALVDKAL